MSLTQINSSNLTERAAENQSLCTGIYYTGLHCRNALQSRQTCLPEPRNSEKVFIVNTLDQTLQENNIINIIYALNFFIKPSDECRSRVVPFLCLYTFGLCSENNVDYRPTAVECSDIRDNICESEWQEANSLLESNGQPLLPDCSSFGDDGLLPCDESCKLRL